MRVCDFSEQKIPTSERMKVEKAAIKEVLKKKRGRRRADFKQKIKELDTNIKDAKETRRSWALQRDKALIPVLS